MNLRSPQIKICGLTSVEEALQCVSLGVDAIGCVFYPKSPRHLTDETAKAICRAVNGRVHTVGVFVNEPFEVIMQKVKDCGLNAVQLHGNESPDLVKRLRREKLTVIKAVFVSGTPSLLEASRYEASAFLVECSQGPLPGGNAMAWDWAGAKFFGASYPMILAGGLTPENVSTAILQALPAAVDVSSGVESSPGRKSLQKIEAFLEAVSVLSDSKLKKISWPVIFG